MGLFFKKKDNSVIEEVIDFLENDLFVSKIAYGRNEACVEDKLVKQLKDKFGEDYVKSQRRIGDNFKMKCDVDVFLGKCGIELKLASSLESKADEFHRAIGQVACYVHEHYKESNQKLILLVVGDGEMSDKIDELKTIVESISRVRFVYKLATNKK